MSLLGKALSLENAELSARVLRLEEELRGRDAALARLQAAGVLQARTQLAEARARSLALQETLCETDQELQGLRARFSEMRARGEAAELALEKLRARCAQAEEASAQALAELEQRRRAELILASALRDAVADLLPTQERLFPELSFPLGPPGTPAEPAAPAEGSVARPAEPAPRWPQGVQTLALLAGNLYHGCRRRIESLALLRPQVQAQLAGQAEEAERLRQRVSQLAGDLEAARAAKEALQESGRSTIVRLRELQALQLGIQAQKLEETRRRCEAAEQRAAELQLRHEELQRVLAERLRDAGRSPELPGEISAAAPTAPICPWGPAPADPAESVGFADRAGFAASAAPEGSAGALLDSAPEVEIPGHAAGPLEGGAESAEVPGEVSAGPPANGPGESPPNTSAPSSSGPLAGALEERPPERLAGACAAQPLPGLPPAAPSAPSAPPRPLLAPPAAPAGNPEPAADESTDLDLQALHGDALRTAKELEPLVSCRSAEIFRLAASGRLDASAIEEQLRLLKHG